MLAAAVHLDAVDVLIIALVGFAAGGINTIVGSGSLITFPTLLAIGYGPLVANVSNTVGLVFGSISGAVGYRTELRSQWRRLLALSMFSATGGLTGSLLLLNLPGDVFRGVVPVLILVACALVILQPRLSARLAKRERHRVHGGPGLATSVYGVGIYGGYFGAAQGVILLALLGIFLDEELQGLNAVKNVLAAIANGVAAVVFIVVAHVAWEAAGLIAAGSIVGGQVGAAVGRRIPAPLLRGLIVVIGLVAAFRLLV
jgi:uncharacterized membrane protein YfcA